MLYIKEDFRFGRIFCKFCECPRFIQHKMTFLHFQRVYPWKQPSLTMPGGLTSWKFREFKGNFVSLRYSKYGKCKISRLFFFLFWRKDLHFPDILSRKLVSTFYSPIKKQYMKIKSNKTRIQDCIKRGRREVLGTSILDPSGFMLCVP